MKTWTVRKILEWTDHDLSKRGIESARLDAEVLLAHVLGLDRLGLYLDLDRPLDEKEREAFREMISRRRNREPVAYLTGNKEFWSLDIEVPKGVLVPRPDTEVLVEEAIELIDDQGRGHLAVDIGCGSGCIGLSLLAERRELRLLAVDVDLLATTVTERNLRAQGFDDRAVVIRGDLLDAVGVEVDIIVSNLPYIPSGEIDELQPEVAHFEPRRALDGGVDGLDLFRRLVDDAGHALTPGGHLLLEVGHDAQARAVEGLFDSSWEILKIRRDYGGIQRVIVAQHTRAEPS